MPDFDIDFCQDRRDEVIRYVQEQIRPRPGRADHHLRHAAGARRAARRRPRAADALRAGRQALQAGAAEPGQSGDAQARDRRRAAAAGRARPRSGGAARLRHRAEARRPAPPRLDARRRHRDRRAAAERAGAALSRSEIQHAGDPVQHEMGGAGGPGEIRLPRPQDADRAGDRGALRRASAASRSICRASRSTTPRPTRCWRAARRSACSRWKVRACGARWSTCGPTGSRTSSRWSRSTGRARWRTSRPIARASTGMEEPDYLHPKLEPILRADLRHHHLPGTGAADRAQILAGYTLGKADLLRRAMGKKIKKEMAVAARRTSSPGAVERGIDRAAGRRDLRCCCEASPNTASTRSHSARLCAAHLPDRLHEGELSGRVPGGVDDARHGQHRQALRIPRRGRAARHQGRCRRRSTARASPSRSRATRSTIRWRRSRASARQAVEAIVAARGDKPFADLSDFAGRINPRAVNKRVLESLAASGAFDELEDNRARAFASVDTILAVGAARSRVGGRRPVGTVRRPGARARRWCCRRSSRGRRPSDCRRSSTPSASSCPAIRSTTMRRRCSACACSRGRSSPAA